jgi:dinuclear metal center YbgI/SA1388 family protein
VRPLELEGFLNSVLEPEKFDDYCHNGIQIEGDRDIKKLVTGVSFSNAFVEKALNSSADAILVHHGIFGKTFFRLTGHLKRRVESVLLNGVTLLGYHLPLDANIPYGNNYAIAQKLGLESLEKFDVGLIGRTPIETTVSEFTFSLSQLFPNQKIFLHKNSEIVQKVCVISGGSSSMLDKLEGIADTFISGEVREPTRELSREMGINYFCVGHYASERFGVMNLGQLIKERFSLDVEFIEYYNEV